MDTDLWSAVRNVLVSANLVTTAGSSSATSAVSVEAAYNDSYVGRPIAVIEPVVRVSDRFKYGDTYPREFDNVIVSCYGKTSLQVDQMSTGIISALASTVIPGVELRSFETDNGLNSPGDSKFYLKTLTFVYDKE